MRFLIRWTLRLAALWIVVLAGLFALWRVAPPISNPMLVRRIDGKSIVRDYVPLSRVSPHLITAVVASEDETFCDNDGVDWTDLWDVIRAAHGGMPARGASTITMQTVKNLFLWPSRSVLRKAIEIPLAVLLDRLWPKRRILEVYLNVAQWGRGLYGVQAAAHLYFDRPAAKLTVWQSALLATSLPDPLGRNPARPERLQVLLARRLEARMRGAAAWLACVTEPHSPSLAEGRRQAAIHSQE